MYLVALVHKRLSSILVATNFGEFCIRVINSPMIDSECSGGILVFSPGKQADILERVEAPCTSTRCLVDLHAVWGFRIRRFLVTISRDGRVSYYVLDPTYDMFRLYVAGKYHGLAVEVFEALVDSYVLSSKPYLLAHLSMSPPEPVQRLLGSCRDVCGEFIVNGAVLGNRASIDIVALPGYEYVFRRVLVWLFRRADVVYSIRLGRGSGLITGIVLETYLKRNYVKPTLLTDFD